MQFRQIHGHKNTIDRLIESEKNNRISHALLFLGPEGIGKISLAIAFAQYLNCTDKKNGDSCGECKSCKKFANLAHPDLHFFYPVIKTDKIKEPVSLDYLPKWREYILGNKFHSFSEWLDFIGTENSQASIYSQESQEIIRIINLKTYESKYKILIIYLPEKMNIIAANKLLKAIEEPPPDTLFILISENEGEIITTIRSRIQLIKLSNLNETELLNALKEEFAEKTEEELNEIVKISSGNYVYAKQIIKQETGDISNSLSQNFEYFGTFMRLAFMSNFKEIISFVDILSGLGRERQKSFIEYSVRFLRENFVLNTTNNQKLVNLTKKESEFAEKFNQFINSKNIFRLFDEFNKAFNDISRNASAKIVFTDLCLKVSILLKIK